MRFDAVSTNGGTVATNGDGTFRYTPASSFEGNDSFTYTLVDDDMEESVATVFVRVISPGSGGVEGLMGYWPMSEGAGATTADASGNGRTGTLMNGPLWGAEPGLDFDGIDDYVDVGKFDVSGSAITLTARFRADNLANCANRDCRILSKADSNASQDHYFMISTIKRSGGRTRLRFRLKTGDSTATLIASSGNLVEDEWVHVAAVFDGSTMKLYKDGVLVGSLAKMGTIASSPDTPVWIGGNPPDAAGRPWDGHIDEVRIYDTALNVSEIQQLISGNQQPVAVDDPGAATTQEDTAVTTINVLANDTVVDNAVISAFDAVSANNGTVSDNGDGTFDYQPAAGFSGTDTFTYTLTDDDLESDSATVTLTVLEGGGQAGGCRRPRCREPRRENTPVTTANVLANDTLLDNAAISAFDTKSSNGGSVASNADGTFLYTPAVDFNGPDSFTYTLTDDDGESDEGTVSVTVTAVDSGDPVADDDNNAATTPENTPVTTINVLANDTLVDNANDQQFRRI